MAHKEKNVTSYLYVSEAKYPKFHFQMLNHRQNYQDFYSKSECHLSFSVCFGVLQIKSKIHPKKKIVSGCTTCSFSFHVFEGI